MRKVSMNDEPTQSLPAARSKRVLIGLAWGLVQLAILFALLFAGGVAAGYLATDVFGGRAVNSTVLIGIAVGVIAAMVVDHSGRGWLQPWRLRRLRVYGVSVQATVASLRKEYAASGRGPGLTRYVVHVRWQDPDTGAGWQGERRYRFSGRGSRHLEAACARHGRVAVYYPGGRPSRFIIDIPFAPTMADLFL